MIHTFELTKMLSPYVDQYGNSCTAEDMYMNIISTLGLHQLDKNNKNCYGTQKFADRGFRILKVCKIKQDELPEEQRLHTRITSTWYYMLSVSVTAAVFGGDWHLGFQTDILASVTTEGIYREIFKLIPFLEHKTAYNRLTDRPVKAGTVGHIYVPDVEEAADEIDRMRFEWIDANYFKVSRVDFAYDMRLYPELYLSLIKQGYAPCSSVYERKYSSFGDGENSVYYKGKGANINIYLKDKELERRNIPHRSDTNYDFLRIEIQVKKRKLNNILTKLKNQEISGGYDMQRREIESFATPEVEEYVLQYYVKALTGEGSYYPYDAAVAIINYLDETRHQKKTMITILKCVKEQGGIQKLLAQVQNGTITQLGSEATVKRYLKKLDKIGINPVTLPDIIPETIKEKIMCSVDNEQGDKQIHLKTPILPNIALFIEDLINRMKEHREKEIPIGVPYSVRPEDFLEYMQES